MWDTSSIQVHKDGGFKMLDNVVGVLNWTERQLVIWNHFDTKGKHYYLVYIFECDNVISLFSKIRLDQLQHYNHRVSFCRTEYRSSEDIKWEHVIGFVHWVPSNGLWSTYLAQATWARWGSHEWRLIWLVNTLNTHPKTVEVLPTEGGYKCPLCEYERPHQSTVKRLKAHR